MYLIESERSYLEFLPIFGKIDSSFHAELKSIKFFASRVSSLKLKTRLNSSSSLNSNFLTELAPSLTILDSARFNYTPVYNRFRWVTSL